MRTHIRMHFDKKTSDFNEENYITCILEEDGVEVPPATQIQSEPIPSILHYCDMCNYSSSYKGNVVSSFFFFLFCSKNKILIPKIFFKRYGM